MIKQMFGDYVAEQARWRQQKASEYPEDVRNARSGDGLSDLALYIRGLPDDDPRLAAIEREHDYADAGTFMPGEVTARLISRFRFNIPNETFDGLLIRIPEALAEDHAQFAHEALSDPTLNEGSSEMEQVIQRLRATQKQEASDVRQTGREAGAAWAKEDATARELEDVASLASELWVAWSMPESLVVYLENHEVGEEFGYRFDSSRGAQADPHPLTHGLIEGAAEVWEAVKDKL